MKIFRGHIGLGDHIVCNALVRHLAKDDTIIVPVKKHYETSIKFMFRDNPNIIIKPFSKDKKVDKFCRKQAKKGIETIWNGHIGTAKEMWEKSNSRWDQKFYEQLNVDFSLRWDNFKLPNNSCDWKKLFRMRFPDIKPEGFIFLHNMSSTGEKQIRNDLLDKKKQIFVPDITFTDNFFDYVGLLENASEIHCIDSSFLCLADSLDLKGNLHYHGYSKNLKHGPTLRKKWIVHRE